MDDAHEAIRRTLTELKTFLAQESVPRLSEADTKAYFVEPIIAALGWVGIGVVTREYYVKNSQEFIDYVLFGSNDRETGAVPVLAIETKALQVDLTEKNAAQLIQYCAVEGIEWAALTNGRELQFFNAFLKPDLAAKRVMRLDLLAFNSNEEFDILFEQLWQLSRESITTASVRTWLNQLRLDKVIRQTLLNPGSSTNKHLLKLLVDAEIPTTPKELVQWFRTHLVPSIPRVTGRSYQVDPAAVPGSPPTGIEPHSETESRSTPTPYSSSVLSALQEAVNGRIPGTNWRTTQYYWAAEAHGRTFLAVKSRSQGLVLGLSLDPETSTHPLSDNLGQFNWSRITKVLRIGHIDDINGDLLALVESAANYSPTGRNKRYFGISLAELVSAGTLSPGTPLVFTGRGQDLAHAEVNRLGEIVWEGKGFKSPSDRAFGRVLGRPHFNGWTHWFAVFPEGRVPLAEVRSKFLRERDAGEERLESTI